MGLFDKIKGNDMDQKLTKEEAFAAIPLAAIAADGVITEEEANGLIVSIIRMKLYRGYDGRQLGNILNKDVNIIKKQGLDALVNMAKDSIPADLKTTAFAIAADLALADGEIAKEEKDILTKIHVALGVPEDEAIKIIEVMLVKNKG